MGTAKALPAVAAKGCAAGGGSGRLPEKRSAEEGGDTACARPAAASSTKGRAYHHHPRRRLALLEETRNTRGKVSLAASPVAMVMVKVSSIWTAAMHGHFELSVPLNFKVPEARRRPTRPPPSLSYPNSDATSAPTTSGCPQALLL
jgi:hypothetical protein